MSYKKEYDNELCLVRIAQIVAAGCAIAVFSAFGYKMYKDNIVYQLQTISQPTTQSTSRASEGKLPKLIERLKAGR